MLNFIHKSFLYPYYIFISLGFILIYLMYNFYNRVIQGDLEMI